MGLRDEGQGLRDAPEGHEGQAWFPGTNSHKAVVSTRAKGQHCCKAETSLGSKLLLRVTQQAGTPGQ